MARMKKTGTIACIYAPLMPVTGLLSVHGDLRHLGLKEVAFIMHSCSMSGRTDECRLIGHSLAPNSHASPIFEAMFGHYHLPTSFMIDEAHQVR